MSDAGSGRRRLSRTGSSSTAQTPTYGTLGMKPASSAALRHPDIAENEPAVTSASAEPTTTRTTLVQQNGRLGLASAQTVSIDSPPPNVYPNGYQFPPKHTWGQATSIALRASLAFVLTPLGFLITIYGLNVVAWGGMLFLLLCNAAPAMCRPTCNDINSPRRIWIEIDSQILNALFCVTGFGLIPWRFRDLYYLLRWRWCKDTIALRRLAGFHVGWFRLPGSDTLDPVTSAEIMEGAEQNPAIPYPVKKAAAPPLTGMRAPPTKLIKLDLVIWLFVWNTFLQVVLSVFMWHYNRIERPSWSTGLFVALACIVAGVAGFIQFREGKKIKKIEGVPVSEEDLARLKRDTDVEKTGVDDGRVVKKEKKWYELRETDRKTAEVLQRDTVR